MSDMGVSRIVRAQQAAEMLEEEKVKDIKEAASLVDIPRSTLNHYIKGRPLKAESNLKKCKLTLSEEKLVIDRCSDLCRWGFPPEVWSVHEIAEDIARARDPKILLGSKWLRGFKKRHPEIVTMHADQIDYMRSVRGDDIKIIRDFFQMYIKVVQEFEIKPSNTYNLDEIGFLMGHAKNAKVLEVIREPRERGKLFRHQDGSREMATVIETICGDATADVDPMIIYKADKIIFEWFKNLPDVPNSLLFGRSPNGWTDKEIAMEYLRKNFGPGSLTATKAGNEYRMLIFDGHNSHVNPRFLDYCIRQKIIPVCLPPHTTHRLQPLDVSIFSAYKTFYSQEITQRYRNRLRGIGKRNFYVLVNNARQKALSTANIRSGFWFTGLIPTDPEIVIRQIPFPRNSNGVYTPDLATNTAASSEHSLIPSIDSYEAEEILEFPTPKKRKALFHLGEILANSMSSNDPHIWRQRHLIDKAIRAGEWAFIQNDLKDQRITELIQENYELKEKEPKRRTQIPIKGLIVTSKLEIEGLWREKKEKEEQRKQVQIEKIKVKEQKLSQALVDIGEKKRKAEYMESENRLPKRWKSSADHAQTEEKIRKDLKDMEQELAHVQVGVIADLELENDSEVEATPEPVLL